MTTTKKTNDVIGEDGAASDYDANSLVTMGDRAHLIKRMGIIFGDEGVDPDYGYSLQKTVAIREIIDNATDEIRGGYGHHVRMHIHSDGCIEVQDSGRGIPVDVNKKTHESGIYMAMGKKQSGGKFGTNSKSYSSGLNGVGGSSTIEISSRADIIVYRGGKRHELSFKDGVPGYFTDKGEPTPSSPFKSLKEMGKGLDYLKSSKDTRTKAEKKDYPTGTIVRIWLNDRVFTSRKPLDDRDLVQRLKFVAFLVPSLTAEVIDDKWEVDGESYKDTFHYKNGIKDMINYLAPSQNRTTEVQMVETIGNYTEDAAVITTGADGKDEVVVKPVKRTVPIQAAFVYNEDGEYNMNSFVNTIHTKGGGVHEKAFEQAFLKAFNDKILSMRGKIKKDDKPPMFEDYSRGLTVVLSIQQSEPGFQSQAKDILSGDENQKAIKAALIDTFTEWIGASKNRDAMSFITSRGAEESTLRQQEKAARNAARKVNAAMRSNRMPENLVDCKIIHDDRSELHICEGRSAMGGLKSARDARFQAIFPIRGKIINAYKESRERVLANQEVQGIITCLGAGMEDDFDVEKMRYGKVIISTDADVDGFAIQNLLLVLFWKIFRPVIDEGRLYISYPPLFELKMRDGTTQYAIDEDELAIMQKDLEKEGKTPGHGYTLERNKGLGAMDPLSARDTLMNPHTRVLRKLSADDVRTAEKMLDLAMGKDAAPRKDWISDNFDTINTEELDV